MSISSSQAFGGGSTPIGAIVAGQFAADANYLPCTGLDYLASDYPLLDKTNLGTPGTNAWVSRTLPTSQAWQSVMFGDKFLALPSSGNAAATSPDGQTWTGRTLPASVNWRAAAYSVSLYVAVATGTTSAASSADGQSWTARAMPSGAAWSCVKYGNGTFMALAGDVNSASTAAATSTDGITWTARTLPASVGWRFIEYGNQVWIAIPTSDGAAGNVSNGAISSDNGVTWDSLPLPASDQWKAFFFYDDLFWLVAQNTALVYTSRDGQLWLARGRAAMGNQIAAMIAGAGILAAVPNSSHALSYLGADGYGTRRRALPASKAWASLAYGANTLVALPTDAANTVCASLALDTTKFRTPVSTRAGEGDRLFIRAK